uniref:Acyltransferase C-terminal domain-containing protein n=2 Tax=Ciona savignyi TaxID=51511 RepID=H2YZF9_CIOSA
MTQGLRKRAAAVYDATVCFRDETDPTLAGMVNGEPSRADFIIRRLPIGEIPENENESAKYVHDIYYEKDRVCEYHKFGGDFHKSDWKSPFYKDHVIRKIPTNTKTNLTLMMWTSLTLFALFYYVTSTLLFGTWSQIGGITAVASIVAAMFYFMMAAGKPKTS